MPFLHVPVRGAWLHLPTATHQRFQLKRAVRFPLVQDLLTMQVGTLYPKAHWAVDWLQMAHKPTLACHHYHIPTTCAQVQHWSTPQAKAECIIFGLALLYLAWVRQEPVSTLELRPQAETLKLAPGAWLAARLAHSRMDGICTSHRGKVLEALPDVRSRSLPYRHTKAQLFQIALYSIYVN